MGVDHYGSDFDNLVLANQPEQALSSWHTAEEYEGDIGSNRCQARIPSCQKASHESIKGTHLAESYSEANMFLAEDFEAALIVFRAIRETQLGAQEHP